MTEQLLDRLLAQLNAAQQEAVSIIDGPALVVAGAGSGKTRVITFRIPYLLFSDAAKSDQILALTFTNKAANEMKERIHVLAGSEFQVPFISTFHSFGSLFLRRHIAALGYSRNFTVYDEDDQLSVVKECCKQLNLNETRYSPKDLQYFIKWYKSRTEPPEVFDPNMQKVLQVYSQKLRSFDAVDFDDLLVLPLKILSENSEILQRYWNAYKYLMVDEYQDTNDIQYSLLKVLAGERANILVVGDEDQSIYKFRGAKPENIQQFLRDYPHAKIVKLEQNYRSTKTIIKAAQGVISNNSSRIKKELWTENQPGEPIEIYHAFDEYDEAAFVTLRVMAALKEYRPSQIGILYRANAQSRALEESFIKAQIPHRIVGAVGFYERREIKDAVSYLRLFSNKNDANSLLRVVNVPPRGAGKKMIEQIQQTADSNGITLYESASQVGNTAVRSFLKNFEPSLHNEIPSSFLANLLQQIGYEDYLRKDDPMTADERMENINEFLAYLRDNESQPDFDLAAFVGSLPLQVPEQKGSEAVTLLTVHSAKGLEFNVLFVAGMEEGLFPHVKSLESTENMEEERRLCYVAMTRAKDKLTMSWAQRRGMFGNSVSNRPSRFLDEIPSWFKVNKISERFGAPQENSGRSYRAADSSAAPEGSPFRVGSVVRHEKLGRGTILTVEGAPNDWKLTIRFPDGIKKIMSRYAQLSVEK